MAFTIEVWRGNKPAKNVRVGVVFHGFLRGNTESHTDSSGRAFFSNNTGNGSVYIDRKCVHEGILSGTIKLTL